MNRNDLWLRLRSLFQRRRVERDLQDELGFHLEMQARKNRSRGVPDVDAERQARLKFGNASRVAEQCRDQRGTNVVDTLAQDIRYAWRQFRRTPRFGLIAVLSLAIGIGANTALFTVFDAMYLRNLSVPRPEDLVSLQWRAFGEANPLVPKRVSGSMMGGADENSGIPYAVSTSFSSAIFEAFRKSSERPAQVFAFSSFDASADIEGLPRDASAQLVSGNYFQALEVKAAEGRTLDPGDDNPDAEPAAVISYFAWKTLFNSDRSAIGSKLRLNGLPVTIVGIMPRDFYLERGTLPAFSVPMAFANRVSQGRLSQPGWWWLEFMARKKPEATIQQVQDSLQGVFQGAVLSAAALTETIPQDKVPRLEALEGKRGFVRLGGDSPEENLLMTVAPVFAVLLLIVCLNLANLLTARAVSREYEIGMRLSLGASRRRVIGQLLTESVLLSALGGVAGAVLAYWGKELLPAHFGQEIQFSVNGRALAFNIGVAVITGLLFGLIPAFRATRSTLSDAAKRGTRHPAQPRVLLNKSLVIVQVAMSVVLLIGAGLLIQSSGNWRRLDMGFDTGRLLTLEVPLPENKSVDLYGVVAERIAAVPGVRAVSIAACFPPSLCGTGLQTTDGPEVREANARYLTVTPSFFDTMGIASIAGRNFTGADTPAGIPKTIIDENLAKKLFPESNPIGKHLEFGTRSGVRKLEIVGVVRNVVLDPGRSRIPSVFYTAQSQERDSGGSFVVRIASDPETVIRGIRRAVADVAPNVPLFGVTTFKQLAERDLSHHRQLSSTWILFGITALLFTAIGLYGLMSYTVSRRVNEIGIRIALGATRLNVLNLVMRQILRLVVVGLAAGFVLSLALHQVLEAYIFEVRLFDPGTLIVVGALVAGVAAIASYLPARRGARIDPVVALRSE